MLTNIYVHIYINIFIYCTYKSPEFNRPSNGILDIFFPRHLFIQSIIENYGIKMTPT